MFEMNTGELIKSNERVKKCTTPFLKGMRDYDGDFTMAMAIARG